MSSPLDHLPLPMSEETQKLVEKCGSLQGYVLHRLRPWSQNKIPRGLKVICLNLVDRLGKAFFGGDTSKFLKFTRVIIEEDMVPGQGPGLLRCTRSRNSQICINFSRFETAPTWKDIFDLVAHVCLFLIQAYSRYKGLTMYTAAEHLQMQKDALTRINELLKH